MQIGVISDVHGNRVALEAVLDDMPAVDRIVCAGDVVGYNPWPGECVDLVREHCDVTVEGNHDRNFETPERYSANVMAHHGLEIANETLSKDQKRWIRNLPKCASVADDRLLVAHSHPRPERRGMYVRPDAFSEIPAALRDEYGDAYDGVILGHTHVQHAAEIDDCLVLNPGSVGQPRDGDPRAAYAVVDADAMTADLYRTDYDVGAVQDEIRRRDLPRKTGLRLERGE